MNVDISIYISIIKCRWIRRIRFGVLRLLSLAHVSHRGLLAHIVSMI